MLLAPRRLTCNLQAVLLLLLPPPSTSLLLKQSKSRESRPHIRGRSQEEGEEGTQQEGEQVEHGREDHLLGSRTSNREKEKEGKGREGEGV